jgi:tripartite-type tricarboxylate transporter receptor subunit TctC
MRFKTVKALVALLLPAMLAWSPQVRAQASQPAWPAGKVVKLVVPFTAGTSLDSVARMFATWLAQKAGGNFIVDNRAGAGGLIGAEYVARSPADGYTLLVVGQSITTAKMLNRSLSFEPLGDLVPVTQIGVNDIVLVTNPAAKVKSLSELVARTKAQPQQFNYATTGRGAVNTLIPELLRLNMGLTMTQVMYKGANETVTALIRNEVQLSLHTPSQVVPHVKAGTVQPLVAVADKRLQTMPDVPTLAEAGYQGVVPVIWTGLMTPKDTPPAVIHQIEALFAEAAKDPDMQKKVLDGAGVNLTGMPSEQFKRVLANEVQTWERVIKAANIQPE